MTYQDRITTDPNVLRGKAVIKDTRIHSCLIFFLNAVGEDITLSYI